MIDPLLYDLAEIISTDDAEFNAIWVMTPNGIISGELVSSRKFWFESLQQIILYDRDGREYLFPETPPPPEEQNEKAETQKHTCLNFIDAWLWVNGQMLSCPFVRVRLDQVLAWGLGRFGQPDQGTP